MQLYNDPAGGIESTIEGPGSTQMNTYFWQRKALIDAAKGRWLDNSSRIRSLIRMLASTAIPNVKIIPAIPGSVRVMGDAGSITL